MNKVQDRFEMNEQVVRHVLEFWKCQWQRVYPMYAANGLAQPNKKVDRAGEAHRTKESHAHGTADESDDEIIDGPNDEEDNETGDETHSGKGEKLNHTVPQILHKLAEIFTRSIIELVGEKVRSSLVFRTYNSLT